MDLPVVPELALAIDIPLAQAHVIPREQVNISRANLCEIDRRFVDLPIVFYQLITFRVSAGKVIGVCWLKNIL